MIRHDREDALYRALANDPAYDAVGQVRSAVGGSSRLCSGTLIAPNWVLTAAHCLTNTTVDNVYYRNFGQSLDAKRIIVHPQFNGSASTGYDVGLIELAEPSALVTPAQRMRDLAPLGQTTTIVGYGLTGTGLTGSIVGTHGTKRAGQNIVDRSGAQVFDEFERPYPEFMLFTDFDNPENPLDSEWGSDAPLELEYQTAGGDSGGGWFLNHQGRARLYAVHSVGLSFDQLQDNDYGDSAGGTRVTRFNAWIDQQMADTYWINPTGGMYDNPENWSSSAVPASASNLRFSFPLDYAVELSGDHTAARWTVDAGDVSFQMANGDLQLGEWSLGTGSAARLRIGATHTAEVRGLNGDGLVTVFGGGSLRMDGQAEFAGLVEMVEGRLEVADGAVIDVGDMRWGTAGEAQVELGALARLETTSPLNLGANVALAIGAGATLSSPGFSQAGALSLAGGHVELTGALTQSATAETTIELAPLAAEGAETPLVVGAEATLGGVLRLSLPEDFTLTVDRTLTLVSAAGKIEGMYTSVDWTYLPLGLDYALTYEPNAVRLTLDGPGGVWRLDGDTNRDSIVDLADLNNVRNNFGAETAEGDANGDGRVDLADLNAVRNHFGRRSLALAAPEPSAAWLAVAGTLAAMVGGRRLWGRSR